MQGGYGDLFATIDLTDAVDRALARLPDEFREAIILVDLEDQSYAAASGILRVPVGTVRSRLFRGRPLLQEALLAYARDAGLVRDASGPPSRLGSRPMTDMRPMLDCDAVMRQLWDYLDGELTPARTEAIREHLALCARCFPQLEFERAFRHTRPDGSRTRELRGASGPRRLRVAHRRIRGVIPG